MPRLVFSHACLAAFFLAASLSAADWPTYLGDNARTGASSAELAAPLRLSWVYSAPAAPEVAFAGPRSEPIEGQFMRQRIGFDAALPVAVAGEHVYFGSSVDNKIYCRLAATGEEVWSFYTEGPIRLAPTVWQGKVYVGSDDGCVYCLDSKTGKQVWKLRVGPENELLLGRGEMISRWPVRTGVLIDQGVAYFGAGVFPHETVYLCAADAATGKLLWKNDHISQADAGRNDLSPQGYLLMAEDFLVVPSGRSLPAAFDKKTGEQLFKKTYSWRSTAGGVVGGSKAVLADGQIYASGPHHFLALNQTNGGVGHAWIAGRQLAISKELGVIADGNRIAAVNREQHAVATRKRQDLFLKKQSLPRQRSRLGTEEYQRQMGELNKEMAELGEVGVVWSTPADCDSALIVTQSLVFAGGQGKVIALDSITGKQVWYAEVKGEVRELAAGANHLFVSTDAGQVLAFASAELESKEVKQHPAPPVKTPFPDDELTAVYEQAAEKILKESGIRSGYCLVIGSEKGRLAYELARRSDLVIHGIEADNDKADLSRWSLARAGLYGTRVTIHKGDPREMPFSNYFANLIVSDSLLLSGNLPSTGGQITRRLKPCGGKICFLAKGAGDAKELETALTELAVENSEVKIFDGGALLTRGKLPGAGSWSHQYGTAANTNNSNDFRVKGGLGVLWYGDPGPAPMINRHEAAAAPLSTNGRMFIQGIDSILCYDAYNGQFLWEYKNPGAIRTGVFNNEETSNIAATDDALFVAAGDTCTMLSAATGEVLHQFKTPDSPDEIPRSWGFVSATEGLLLGTSTIRKELAAALRRRGRTVDSETDALFAVDPATGERIWEHRGKNILHVTIAVHEGRVFFIDSSITSEQRQALLSQDKTELKDLPPDQAAKKEAELKKLDVRLAVALDLKTGKELWSKPVDVTDCSHVATGGGNIMLMAEQNRVVICGANANGHYWRQFLSGEFDKRRILVLDAENGEKLWAKDTGHRHRPIIIEDEIYAEPWAFNLHSGAEKMRENPLTGEKTPWQFVRPGHHCGAITAAPNMLLFRSGFTGYYDLYNDFGTSHFAGHRMGCWVNAIPGNGLVMIPEASAGCVCQFSIAATVVMEPREERQSWGIFSASGAKTPVQKMALNLGAPGDRKDSHGTLWLAYPRPNAIAGLDLPLRLNESFAPGGKFFAIGEESLEVAGNAPAWLSASGARGLQSASVRLRKQEDGPAKYTVTLHFAQPDSSAGFSCSVKLQGEVAAKNLEVAAAEGSKLTPVAAKFPGILVEDDLVIEIHPAGEEKVTVTAIEIEREKE